MAPHSSPRDWRSFYSALVEQQATLIERAGPLVAGFSATTDAVHRLSSADLQRLMLGTVGGSEAFRNGIATLREWLRAGRDGELFIDDESGEELLEQLAGPPALLQCGGTSIQACWSWSALGLQPLLSLQNRSARQLDATPPGVQVLGPSGPEPVRRAEAGDDAVVPSNHVLEFSRGTRGGDVTIERSSRITVVLTRKRLQMDERFLRDSPAHVRGGVALVSGLNGLGRAREVVLPILAETVARWREAGARLVHLELAEYSHGQELARVMEIVGPHVQSVGMNGDELSRLVGPGTPAEAAHDFAQAHDLRRVVVHSDRWAMSVHRGDPRSEERALAAGSLAAANRAESGQPRGVWTLPAAASFAEGGPRSGSLGSGYHATVVSTPYLSAPHSTIGLGDTFVSGDLLAQASPA
ncbi:ADP-dependent glucokinase/phosphofructokinase [Bogoriella caseilytica]|uniref:ADP-dependent phosphofructokinase/glucokinase n=1 Tax=Bogoriella caseilytica TaxID=56055 RepID=A0A3N2BD24_9MICO|nr:ADP-dependent glucokinase/phosphofructokinase [Bogoriella caseilytica]ROR73153.1 ADP-dependent phosphofructokinase/glucokinase [Bogoriella caseilytica]